MDETQESFYRMAFKVKFLEFTGEAFQDFFSTLMQYAHRSNFQKVRPYGKDGDLKCDGYLISSKTVFQCYAPLEIKKAPLIKKINEDFEGAKAHWGDKMAEWVFVHNGRNGLPAEAVQLLGKLKAAESEMKIKSWTLPELFDELDKLSLRDLAIFLGSQPTSRDMQSLSRQHLQAAVDHLKQVQPNPEIILKAPSPQKLSHNNLSRDTQAFLEIGRRREHAVQDFFETHPNPDLSDSLAEYYGSLYKSLKEQSCSAEEIFARMLKYSGFGKGPSTDNAALLTLMAYFFERCEIFEDPYGKVISS